MSDSIAREIQEREGWNDDTLLELLLDYITNQQSDEAFRDFLEEAAMPADAPQPFKPCDSAWWDTTGT